MIIHSINIKSLAHEPGFIRLIMNKLLAFSRSWLGIALEFQAQGFHFENTRKHPRTSMRERGRIDVPPCGYDERYAPRGRSVTSPS